MTQFYIEARGLESPNSGRNPVAQSQMRFHNLAGVLEKEVISLALLRYSNTEFLLFEITVRELNVRLLHDRISVFSKF
jgi:hypothetical protein